MRIWDAVVEEESFWATSVVKKQQMVAWRGVAAPGGNGDGWTNRETPAHRNGAAVCVKPQTKREIENNPAAACQSPSATSSLWLWAPHRLPSFAKVRPLYLHGTGVAPIQREVRCCLSRRVACVNCHWGHV
jgi:hypothetical protein